MSEEMHGENGELIQRLLSVVNQSPEGYPLWWADAGVGVAANVGGEELVGLRPDIGKSYPPGSVGASVTVVSREEYFDLLGERLVELVLGGVAEEFLVRALRDELGRYFTGMADTGKGDAFRSRHREQLLRDAEDPEAIAAFRSALARSDPNASAMTDEQVALELRAMAEWPHL